MLFDDSVRTRYDLSFRLFRFPVRVSILHWLTLAIIFADSLRLGVEVWLVAILCGFVSLLWHELGHAFAMKYYGSPARIELIALGGFAAPTYVSPNPWRRMMIAAAGPIATFLLAAAAWGIQRMLPTVEALRLVRYAFAILVIINIVWGVFNLIPIWPMDGSRILREVLSVSRFRNPDYSTQWVSLVVAAILAIYGFLIHFGPIGFAESVANTVPDWMWWVIPGKITTFFFGYLAYLSYVRMTQLQRPRLYMEH